MSKEKVKCFVVGSGNYNTTFCDFIENYEEIKDIEKADLVIFTGGEDINPEIYNEKRHPRTGGVSEHRDRYEITMFKTATVLKKTIFGICRGAQLAGALSGAKLVQHQESPHGHHDMKTSTGDILPTTHAHHQSLNLEGLNSKKAELLAWDEREGIVCYGNSYAQVIERDKHPEFVWFPETKVLAYQGHPEWMHQAIFNDTKKYINKIIQEKLNK